MSIDPRSTDPPVDAPGPSAIDTHLLLVDAREGSAEAKERLFAHLYGELQRLARSQLRRSRGESLQTTELVHEAYLKLCRADRLSANDRSHFFAIAASAMRQILVDHFRRGATSKRGAARPETLDEAVIRWHEDGAAVLAIDEALKHFADLDARAARVVELKFFGGLTEDEIAAALDVSIRTVSGDWRRARAWLHRELTGEP
ncbi:MAG: ECF-type sigma factor [Acidobacteriota bacterium]